MPAFLKQPGPDDAIIVYFSGHGFRDAAGKMYLAPIDCNPDDLLNSAIAVEWFRQKLAECKAHFKLLILDSCHAGSEKGESDGKSLTAKDIGEPFQDLEGVVTLASSTAKEKSQIWEEKQQSLFSYWLNQGLRGNADDNNDNAVDIDELYKYVYRHVTRTAKLTQPLPQTPVRIVRSGTPDVPVVAYLQPLTLRQVIADTAEQMADAIEERQDRTRSACWNSSTTRSWANCWGPISACWAATAPRNWSASSRSRRRQVHRRRSPPPAIGHPRAGPET